MPVSELYFLMNGYGDIEQLHHEVMISSDCLSLGVMLRGLFLWMMKAGRVINEDDFFYFFKQKKPV